MSNKRYTDEFKQVTEWGASYAGGDSALPMAWRSASVGSATVGPIRWRKSGRG